MGIDPGAILIEPEFKNTAPAILAACIYAMRSDPDAILLVAPSDHVISDTSAFHAAVQMGLEQVENGKVVTFGISPTHPETGYGYLEVKRGYQRDAEALKVSRFVEKPDLRNAERMLKSGNYLWNAGIFLFKAADMLAAFEKFEAETLALVQSAVLDAKVDLGFLRLCANA